MVIRVPPSQIREPAYTGLRLTSDEYLALPEDGFKYELINGIVIMSPSATPRHQSLLFEILGQLHAYLSNRPLGRVMPEVDVRLGPDLVYRPDAVFLAAGRLGPGAPCVNVPPELVIEIISPGSRSLDLKTKRADYEQFGVREYWVVDPAEESVRVYRLRSGAYAESIETGDRVACEVVPGFTLDLGALRPLMRA